MSLTTEDQVAAQVREATGALRIRGGGTRDIGRPVAGEVLSTAALTGITLYDPGALTMVVRAGTPLTEIEAALAAENQRLAFEPMDHRALLGTQGEPTIGGVVAANVSGPRRITVGACRDFLLGVRFVDGSGTIIKNGGRVMKNVTGYDLVKLLAGSYGTLGVITEVSFKVLPTVEAAASLSIAGLDARRAVTAMSAALGSPFEVTGAAHADGVTHLRIEGFASSVAYRAARLAEVLAPFGATHVATDPAEVAATWQGLRDVTSFAGRAGDVWRFSVKPTDAPALIDHVMAQGALDTVLDWGGGLVWVLAPEGSDLRAPDLSGHATLVRASTATRQRIAPFHPEPAPLAALAAGLRAKFDPRGILNPGLMT